MRWTAALLALALSACVATPAQLTADPDVPRLHLTFENDWRSSFQAINAGLTRCVTARVTAAEDAAMERGTITVAVNTGRVIYVIDVEEAGQHQSEVVVTMPTFAEKQARTWPDLLQKWVMEGDRTSCP